MFYAEEYKEKNESFVSVNRFIQPRKANEVTSDETKRSLGKNSLSDARPLLVQLKNDHPTETAVKSDKLTTESIRTPKTRPKLSQWTHLVKQEMKR